MNLQYTFGNFIGKLYVLKHLPIFDDYTFKTKEISSDIGILYLKQIRIIFRGLPLLKKCQMLSTRPSNLTACCVTDSRILINAGTNLTEHRNSVLITFLFYKLYVLQTLKWLTVYPRAIMPVYFLTMYDKILKSMFVKQ